MIEEQAKGKVVISAELDLKIQKTIRRAARNIALRLYLAQPRLYAEFFSLKCKRALLHGLCEARRYLFD